MGSIASRNDLAEFLNNSENAQKFNSLVEDVRYVLMDYRVRALK